MVVISGAMLVDCDRIQDGNPASSPFKKCTLFQCVFNEHPFLSSYTLYRPDAILPHHEYVLSLIEERDLEVIEPELA
jgi:hypothetical protein